MNLYNLKGAKVSDTSSSGCVTTRIDLSGERTLRFVVFSCVITRSYIPNIYPGNLKILIDLTGQQFFTSFITSSNWYYTILGI